MTASTVSVFFSYVPADEDLKIELTKHLKILKRNGIIDTWYDRDVQLGAVTDEEIRSNLMSADIILFLISSDLLASDEIWDLDVATALERNENPNDHASVVPIILRPCEWQQSPFGKLAPAPRNGVPVISHASHDEAFAFITERIRALAAVILDKKMKPGNGNSGAPEKKESFSSIEKNKSENIRSEMEGLLKSKEILIQKLNYLRGLFASKDDGSKKFELTMDIKNAEVELINVNQRISELRDVLD